MKKWNPGLLLLLLPLCGCGNQSLPKNANVVVTISPNSVTLEQLQTQTFSVTVTGADDPSVIWSIQESPSGGTVTDGLYTAPASAGSFHLIATSKALPSSVATASVTVRPVVVTLSPTEVWLDIASNRQFSAAVSGSMDKSVSWSLQEDSIGGAVSDTGLYTPGTSSGQFHVLASSHADPTKTASATAHVSSGIIVSVGPHSVSLDQGATTQFTASVVGTSNPGLTWSIAEGSAGGSISPSGLYTAPKTAGTYHVLAASSADTTKYDQASVTANEISVAVRPTAANVQQGHSKTFQVEVLGTVNKDVTWLVLEGAVGGTIDSTALYTAPGQTGTFNVTATSVSDPSKSDSAIVRSVLNGFTRGPEMNSVRYQSTATVLGNGDVLVVGGTVYTDPSSPSAELLHQSTSQFAPTGSTLPRDGHTATLLPDGRVLIVGGWGTVNFAIPGGELYNPADGTFMPLNDLYPVSEHAAVALSNGKVLITGGLDYESWDTSPSAYLFDPTTNTAESINSMTTARSSHAMVAIGGGKVLICGGDMSGSAEASAEIYDSNTNTFSPTGSMNHARWGHSATLLADGKVLVTGGTTEWSFLDSAEVFDPVTGQFREVGSMMDKRQGHTALLLPNGTVLIAGGFNGYHVSELAELYDPATETFWYTGDLIEERSSPTAVLLPDASVLVVGGGSAWSEIFR